MHIEGIKRNVCAIIRACCGRSSSVEPELPKLLRWVRLPSPAPLRFPERLRRRWRASAPAVFGSEEEGNGKIALEFPKEIPKFPRTCFVIQKAARQNVERIGDGTDA